MRISAFNNPSEDIREGSLGRYFLHSKDLMIPWSHRNLIPLGVDLNLPPHALKALRARIDPTHLLSSPVSRPPGAGDEERMIREILRFYLTFLDPCLAGTAAISGRSGPIVSQRQQTLE